MKSWCVRLLVLSVVMSCVISFLPYTAWAKSVYDGQPPVTDKELVTFIELLPHFRAWAVSAKEEAYPYVNKQGQADFMYSPQAAEWVQTRGWAAERFFNVMGRMAAALSLVEEGSDVHSKRPPDMPAVSQQEMALVRRHLAGLLKAGSDAPPIQR